MSAVHPVSCTPTSPTLLTPLPALMLKLSPALSKRSSPFLAPRSPALKHASPKPPAATTTTTATTGSTAHTSTPKDADAYMTPTQRRIAFGTPQSQRLSFQPSPNSTPMQFMSSSQTAGSPSTSTVMFPGLLTTATSSTALLSDQEGSGVPVPVHRFRPEAYAHRAHVVAGPAPPPRPRIRVASPDMAGVGEAVMTLGLVVFTMTMIVRTTGMFTFSYMTMLAPLLLGSLFYAVILPCQSEYRTMFQYIGVLCFALFLASVIFSLILIGLRLDGYFPSPYIYFFLPLLGNGMGMFTLAVLLLLHQLVGDKEHIPAIGRTCVVLAEYVCLAFVIPLKLDGTITGTWSIIGIVMWLMLGSLSEFMISVACTRENGWGKSGIVISLCCGILPLACSLAVILAWADGIILSPLWGLPPLLLAEIVFGFMAYSYVKRKYTLADPFRHLRA